MLQEQTQLFLEKISKIPHLHARFLNTLSLLEYIGARKIGKSQREKEISLQLLGHWSEEIRHAQMFKKCALQVSSGALIDYRDDFLWCGQEARNYIQEIDHAVESLLERKDAWLNYIYATFLIEERANQVYSLYEPILSALGLGGFLRAILREEKTHLDQMLTMLQNQTTPSLTQDSSFLTKLRLQESQAFTVFLDSMHVRLLEFKNEPAKNISNILLQPVEAKVN